MARKAAYTTAAWLLPAAIVLLAEVLLRLCSYGDNLDLFVAYPPDSRYLMFNPKASHRYATGTRPASTDNTELFQKEKAPNTLRLFILGQSTAAGYPYFHNGAFHRWLQYRLMNTFPGRKFEIINLALADIDTHTIAGFAKELIPYKPDAVLIYTGHNEYDGAHGATSAESEGYNHLLTAVMPALGNLRLMQALSSLITMADDADIHTAGTARKLTNQSEIPYGSEQYNRSLEQFRNDLDATLQTLDKHNIPVFVSTQISNIRDIKPFRSKMPDRAEHPVFYALYTKALQALDAHDSATAYTLLQNASVKMQGLRVFTGKSDKIFP